MQQADAPDAFESMPVITSPATPLQPELSGETENTSEDDLNNRNTFADLARAKEQVQSSQCDRRTRLMPPNRFQ
eukprot:7978921-Pyramimonas_sp.AAC.1